MIALKRILVPIDFSDCSRKAMTYACALAERFGAELHVLYVVQDLVAVVPDPRLGVPMTGDFMRELRERAAKELAAMPMPDCPPETTPVRTVRSGVPFLEIVRYAREANVDLIVLGTHGRTGLSHVLLGSVAEKVVRKAPCAVLTVRPDEHEFVLP